MNFLKRLFSKEEKQELDQSLEKTRQGFFQKLSKAIIGKSTVDDDVLDELEQILIGSDVGVDTTLKIIQRIQARIARDKYVNTSELHHLLKDEIASMFEANPSDMLLDFTLAGVKRPYILLVVGVNGVGKTTTIGKLAHQYTIAGQKVLLAAGDTFRAAAVQQLEIWSQRVGCGYFSKGMQVDPASVAYEATKKAIQEGYDLCIIDTAGRLHTKVNLMQELEKIQRSIDKALPGAPNEVLLVLDATTGQNALEQCKVFSGATHVSALALTKLDGTAKGGIAIGITDQFRIPIKYLGVGEQMHQLQLFDKFQFVESLFSGAFQPEN